MTATTSATPPQDSSLRIVVYCDDVAKPFDIPDVRLPRHIHDLVRLVEDHVDRRVKIMSYWNYSHKCYQLLRDMHDLLQPEGVVTTVDSSINAVSTPTNGGSGRDGIPNAKGSDAASVTHADSPHTGPTIYRCQLWIESVFIQLEPLDEQRDQTEYGELRDHVARWLGNTHISYDLVEAARIRCPLFTRLFDQARNARLADNQNKVQLLYYSNNAWCVRDVLKFGFLRRNGVPSSLTSVLQSCVCGDTPEVSSSGDAQLSVPTPTPREGGTGAAGTSPSPPRSATLAPVPPKLNTRENPFIFTSSMLGTNVKRLPADTEPHKVLLCEVAPGRRFMTDQPLTGDPKDTQTFPVPVTKNLRGYDSTCYVRLRKHEGGGSSAEERSFSVEDAALIQVQVQHSFQALPRYLLTVVPSSIPPSRHAFRSGSRSVTASPLRSPGPAARAAPAGESEDRNGRRTTAGLSRSASEKAHHARDWLEPTIRHRQSSVKRHATPTREKSLAVAATSRTSPRVRKDGNEERSSPLEGANRRKDEFFARSGHTWADVSFCRSVSHPGGGDDDRGAAPRSRQGSISPSWKQRPPLLSTPPKDAVYPLHTEAAAGRKRAGSLAFELPHVITQPLHNGILYEGLPRNSGGYDPKATPSFPASSRRSSAENQRAAGREKGLLCSTSPASPPDLLPGRRNSLVKGSVGTAQPIGHPASVQSPIKRTSNSIPMPLAPFACAAHPGQLQTLFCKACGELTCPYCASLGVHRDHVVVEANEKAIAIRADAEALHEELRHWLVHYQTTEKELKAQGNRYAMRQQRELHALQQHFSKLKAALGKSERDMTQVMQQPLRRAPLAEAAAVVDKYTQAIAPIHAALRRYYTATSASSAAFAAATSPQQDRGTRNASVAEMLHLVHTVPLLLHRVQESFVQRNKTEERRLRDAVIEYEAQVAKANEVFANVDWVGLRRMMENIPHVRTNLAKTAMEQQLQVLEQSSSDRDASSPLRRSASAFSATRGGSRAPSAALRLRSVSPHQSLMRSPITGHDLSHRLLNSPPLRMCENSGGEGADLSPSKIPHRSLFPVMKQDQRLQRCLIDLQRGYIWTIQNASTYFAPGQHKAVCSTTFRLLGVLWELRIAPLPAVQQKSSSISTVELMPGMSTGVTSAAASRRYPLQLHTEYDGDLQVGDGARSPASASRSFPVDRALANDGVKPSFVTVLSSPQEEEEEEWLGLFLFPQKHQLRMDFRVIAFSEVTWTEWQLDEWPSGYAGKGWGLYPFLQRKELMRTDKLARDNTVKICVAPITDLY